MSIPGWRRAALGCLLLAAVFGLVLLANVARGALASGLSAHDDEAGHVITGLLVRDWLAQRDPLHPMAYAELYYLHYPKVAFGHWPPLFYALQGAWTLVLGASKPALIALMSLFSAAIASLLFWAARTRLGILPAALAAALFLVFPTVQLFGAGVMAEIPLALGCLASALAFGAWMGDPRASRALTFGALAAATALIKGNGLALIFLPPLALLASGRWELLRQRSLLLAPLVVVLACAPWFVLTAGTSRATWTGADTPLLVWVGQGVPFYLRELVALGGWATAGLALVGALHALGRWRADGLRMSLLALIPAVILLHLSVPSSLDGRHLTLVAAPLAFFAMQGAVVLAGRVAGVAPRRALLAALALLLFMPNARLLRREFYGYEQVAAGVHADPELDGAALLIASDPIGDGLFITAVALGDERPGHVVLRATKSLCQSTWLGGSYRERFPRLDDLEGWLLSVPVSVIVLDRSTRPIQTFAHQERLAEVVARAPERWLPAGTFDTVRNGERYPGALEVYRLAGPVQRPARPLDADHLLGRRPPSLTAVLDG